MASQSRLGNIAEDVAIKAPVRIAITSNVTLSGLQTFGAITLADSDRVLVLGQTDATQNGIYLVSSGSWIRTADASKNTDFLFGTLVFVVSGTSAGIIFGQTCTDSPVVIGTSLIGFTAQSSIANAAQSSTSTTSLAIGTGAKTFTTQAGKSFAANQWVLAYSRANPNNCMLGQITSYAGTALAISSVAVGGSGTITDWTIVLTNSAAAAGLMPPVGTGNVTGPGSSTSGAIAVYADATGKVVSDSAIVPGTLAGKSTIGSADISALAVTGAALAPGASPLPFIGTALVGNLVFSNDATNPLRDVACTQGRVRDDSDVTNFQLAGTMVKRLDQAWVAGGISGTPLGGLDTGARAGSKTYHWFGIGKLGMTPTQRARASNVATITIAAHGLGVGSTYRGIGIGGGYDGIAQITAATTNTISFANTGADEITTAVAATATVDGFDLLASLSVSAPTMPSGWTVKQLLYSTLTDATPNNYAFLHFGSLNLWKSAVLANGSNFTVDTSQRLYPVLAPKGRRTEVIVNGWYFISSGGSMMYLYCPDLNDPTVTNSAGPGMSGISATGNSATAIPQHSILTDLLGNIKGEASGSGSCTIFTLGYRDPQRALF